MNRTKQKLKNGKVALGAWVMIGHPTVAEIYAGKGFDWICVDMEHTSTDIRMFHELVLAIKGAGCDILARLHSCDPVQAKQVLDIGADGIIVPSVNSKEEAELAVAMAKFPPEGIRGSSLCRANDFGRNFKAYFNSHNDKVLVVVMLEHIDAVENIDEILSVPGIDATFISPYDLSASMGISGQLDHPDLLAAQNKLVEGCRKHNMPAGFHVVSTDNELLKTRIKEGYRFIACGMDTEFVMHGCRTILKGVKNNG
jgi:2-dehydro-3-deoxyglucarate aldolase